MSTIMLTQQQAVRPAPRRPERGTEMLRQAASWVCSAAACSWLARCYGYAWDEQRARDWLLERGAISPGLGLHEGSGRVLAELLRALGLPARHDWRGWDDAWSLAQRQPYIMGSPNPSMYHWVGVRGPLGVTALRLANSASGYQGIYDAISQGEFNHRGPWATVWIDGG